jgi:uncharacterized protein YlxW (UPF0749 family)
MKILKILAITSVCLVLGVLLALQYKGIDMSNKTKADEYLRIEDVKNQLLSEIRKNQELSDINSDLMLKIDEFQNSYGDENERLTLLEADLSRLKMFVGFYSVKGSGLVITLDRGDHEYSSIRDTDLLKLVNELKASGAQAISINGERILAMTEIREAGNYMIINSQKTSEPFIIKAISNKDKLFASINMTGGIVEELSLYMNVAIEKTDDVVIEKINDDGLVIRTDLLKPVD